MLPCSAGPALRDARRLRHAAEERNREEQPPDADAGQRQPDAGARVRYPEPAGLLNHQQVDRQEHAAAAVADGVARRRHAIEVLRLDQVRQQRLVEDDAAGDADVADDEQRQRQAPVAAFDPEERHRRQRPDEREDREHALLQRGVVGDRAEQRGDEGDDHDRDRRRPGEPAGRDGVRQIGGDDALVIDREDGGDDGGVVGRVRPVVHRPGAQLRAAESEPFEQMLHAGR